MVIKEKPDRKQQIHEKAEELFSSRGYLATSMRDLAEAMGMEPASLYSHIPSKDQVLFQIADRCANEFFAAIRPIFESGLNTEKKLTAMIVAHVQVITRNLKASAVFFSEWRHLDDPRRATFSLRRDEYEEIFREVIRKGVHENLFLHFDERFSARTILSALNWTHTWYRPDGELKPEEIGENLAKILLHGLTRNM